MNCHAINSFGNQCKNPSQRTGTIVRHRPKGMKHTKKEKVKQWSDYLIHLVEDDTERQVEKVKAAPGFTCIGKKTLIVGKAAVVSERRKRVSKLSINATPLSVEQPVSNPVP